MENVRFIQRFVNGRKVSFIEKILLCVMASLSCMFYYYEDHLSHSGVIKLAVFCVMILVWLWCALISGRDKKMSFPVFSCIYWSVPYIFSAYYSFRDNVKHYSKALSFLNRTSSALTYAPFGNTEEITEISAESQMMILLALIIGVYFLGYYVSSLCEKAYPENDKDNSETDRNDDEHEYV